jgi:Fe-S cluster biosynthesis and repair protein YggX
MKKIVTLILSLTFFGAIAQSTANKSISGIVKEVKPKFMGAQTLLVNETELVLMANQEDTTNSTFEINKEFSDLLVKDKSGNLVLNQKYRGKSLDFTYFVNGKGWNCISKITASKCVKPKKTKSTHIK